METYYYGNQKIGIKIDEKEYFGNQEIKILREIAYDLEDLMIKYKATLRHLLKQRNVVYSLDDTIPLLEKKLKKSEYLQPKTQRLEGGVGF